MVQFIIKQNDFRLICALLLMQLVLIRLTGRQDLCSASFAREQLSCLGSSSSQTRMVLHSRVCKVFLSVVGLKPFSVQTT